MHLSITFKAVITLRVWYLFPRNKLIRRFAASLYIVCTYSTWVLTGILFKRLFQEMQHPNLVKNPSIFAVLFVPGFVIHTVLFALKIYRYMTSDRFQRRSSLLAGFLKEYAFNLDNSHHVLTVYFLGVWRCMHVRQVCAGVWCRFSPLSCYHSGSILYTIITLTLSNPSQLDVSAAKMISARLIESTSLDLLHRFRRRVRHTFMVFFWIKPTICSDSSSVQRLSPSATHYSAFDLYLRRFT